MSDIERKDAAVAAAAEPPAGQADKSFIARSSGLKLPDYIGYAMGDTACCLVFGLVTSLLQKFYTDIFGLGPLFIMLMMVGARIWDAINDPMMGRIADTIKVSKWGRYRPWFLYASIPLALSSILMFVKWPGIEEGSTGMMVYSTVTYVMFGMSYTALQIPYGSLASVVTTDEGERTKLSVFRSVGAGVGSLPVILIASFCYADRVVDGVPVVGDDGQVIQDMQYTPVIIGVVVLSLLCLVMLLLAFKFNKERVNTAPVAKRAKGETFRILKTLIKNRAFISVSCASMLLLASQMFTQSYYLYLFDDFFGKNWMNTVSTVCTYAPMAILMFFTPKLVRKFGKKELCAVGIAVAAVANLIMFACKGAMPDAWWLFLLLCFLSGAGQAFIILQVWSMATDAIDDIEVKTGLREDGTAYSAFMFFRKLGQVIAAVAVNGALLAMSYKTGKGEVQTPETLSAMYDMATIIPAVLFGIMALILFVWCPLSKKRVAALQLEKEETLKLHYESGAIGIDGQHIMGDAGVSDTPEFPDDPYGVAAVFPEEEQSAAGGDIAATDDSEDEAADAPEIADLTEDAADEPSEPTPAENAADEFSEPAPAPDAADAPEER